MWALYVCMCMHVCMHVCMYVCLIGLRTKGQMSLDVGSVCMHVYVCMYACMYVRVLDWLVQERTKVT
jgi:hypothetical protein